MLKERRFTMKENTVTKNSKRRFAVMMLIACLALLPCAYYAAPFAYAAPEASAIIKSIINIVKLVANIVGILFLLIGIVRFAIAQANEDGPSTQKSIMMLATGVVLLLLGTLIIDAIGFENWVLTEGDLS